MPVIGWDNGIPCSFCFRLWVKHLLCDRTWRKDSRILYFIPLQEIQPSKETEGLISSQLGSKLCSLSHQMSGFGQISETFRLLLSYNNEAKWPSSKDCYQIDWEEADTAHSFGLGRLTCRREAPHPAAFLPPCPPSSSPSHPPRITVKGATFTQILVSELLTLPLPWGEPKPRWPVEPLTRPRWSLEHLLLLHCLVSKQHVPPVCGWPDSYISLSNFADPSYANLNDFSS